MRLDRQRHLAQRSVVSLRQHRPGNRPGWLRSFGTLRIGVGDAACQYKVQEKYRQESRPLEQLLGFTHFAQHLDLLLILGAGPRRISRWSEKFRADALPLPSVDG